MKIFCKKIFMMISNVKVDYLHQDKQKMYYKFFEFFLTWTNSA